MILGSAPTLLTVPDQTKIVRSTEILALPSVLIDFIAMTVCDLIPCSRPRSSLHQLDDFQSMPELVYFIQKITFQAGINCRTALIALIYLNRAKSALPKGAMGIHDTGHRMFLGSLLLASKYLRDTAWSPPFQHNTPLLSTVPSSWSHYYSYFNPNSYCLGPLTNVQLYRLCSGLFSLSGINALERAFLKLIDYRCWVDAAEVNAFVLAHRVDLSL
ncbi:hypothetical protein BDF14DRAFT_1784767 [Spinellus fusiger]|nr:hypothetical protein BDF14DRAFT_1784767 [Spinellus fusiger]